MMVFRGYLIITDILGQVVKEINLNKNQMIYSYELNVQGLKDGIYIYQTFIDGKFISSDNLIISN